MLLIVDLDGVVYRGSEPLPGMAELLRAREAAGDTVVYCTNNSRWYRTEYLDQLTRMGAPASAERIVTSGRATALALTERQPARRVMVLGGAGLARELREVGLAVVPPTDRGLETEPDAVVVGIDFDLTYRRLSAAANAVRVGARFVVTNRDPVYPLPEGLLPGAGAMVAAVEAAAGRSPDLVVGKPEPTLFHEAARVGGGSVSDAVVIGDSLLSDISAANALGARSILMLTGVTSAADLERAASTNRPTAVARDARELSGLLEQMA
jgi:glycerol 3-phosphatase-2